MGVRLPPFALHLLLLVTALCASTSAAQDARHQTRPSQLASIFDDYDRGRFREALTTLRPFSSLKAFATLIAQPEEASAWIQAGDDNARDRRRLIVATVVLEEANLHGLRDWETAQALIEWACTLVRRNLVSAAELAWHRASISLLESGHGSFVTLDLHVGHALKRFPDDPHLILAKAVARELGTFPDPRDGSLMSDREMRESLTIDYFEAPRKLAAVRGEASMRLGYFYLRLDHPDHALPILDDAIRVISDPFDLYLAHLFRGRALERLNRATDAVSAYRAATAAVPGAQTAQLALAAALVKNGQRAEGAAIGAAAVTAGQPPPDPWLSYGLSDGRFWVHILDRLRGALR